MKSLVMLWAGVMLAMSTFGQTLQPATLSTNGTVNVIEQDGDNTYLAGAFSQIGFRTNYHSILPLGSDVPAFDILYPNSNIDVAVSDGAGGWYVGGSFSNISGNSITRLAHILPDMSLDPNFSIPLNSTVLGLYLHEGQLYVGGSFTQADGIPVGRIIRVDANTAELDNGWLPQVTNGDVRKIIVANDLVHVGGSFGQVLGDDDYRRYAIFDINTAEPQPTFSFNSTVEDFMLYDDKLFVAGSFTQTAIYQSYLAGFQPENEFPIFSFPDANSTIEVIEPDGDGGWYVGGSFTLIDGVSRNRMAHILSDGTLDPDFAPSFNSTIIEIFIDGDDLYAGGSFTNVDGVAVQRACRLDKTTGVVDESWLPEFNSTVYSIATNGNDVYVGGVFTIVNSTNDSRYFAIIDGVSGELIQSPSVNSTVHDIEAYDGDYYLAGSFTQSGYYNSYVASVGVDDGLPSADFPDANSTGRVIIPDGNGGWYIGGSFTQFAGVNAFRLVHLLSDNTVDPNFECTLNSNVEALKLDGDDLYIGGAFTTVNGVSLPYAARVNKDSGVEDQTWAPSPNSTVLAIHVESTNVYLGGFFSSISGNPLARYGVAVDKVDGSFLQLPSPNNVVYDFEAYGDAVLASGSFTTTGFYQPYLASFSDASSAIPDFNQNYTNSSIYVMEPDGDGGFYLGGTFTNLNGETQTRIGHILSDGTRDLDFTPTFNSTIHDILLVDDELYVGGSFTNVNGSPATRLVRISAEDGVLDTDFVPEINSTVLAIGILNDVVYCGGAFTTVEGESRNRIAALNAADGSLDTDFAPSLNNQVEDIIIHNGEIYISGYFTTIDGDNSYQRVAALDTDGVPTAFNAGPINNVVFDLLLDGTTLYLAGAFSQVDGSTRESLAAVNVNTGALLAFEGPDMNGQVWSIDLNGNTLAVGGSFTQVEGEAVNRLMELDVTTGDPSDRSFNINSNVREVLYIGNTLNAGGDFTWVNNRVDSRIIEYNSSDLTRNDQRFDNINNTVHDMDLSGDILYFGGSFSTVQGQSRLRTAAVDLTENSILDFNPEANSTVEKMRVEGDLIYIAGSFTELGGETRRYIGAYDINLDQLTAWDPSANSTVFDMRLNGDQVIIVGSFSTVSFQNSRYLIGFDPEENELFEPFSAPPNSTVLDLWFEDDMLLAGGYFTNFDGESRTYYAQYDMGADMLDPFSINLNNRVESIFRTGSKLYLGGIFSTANDEPRGAALCYDLNADELDDWNPKLNSWVYSMWADDNQIILGGPFSAIDVQNKSRIACVNPETGAPEEWGLSNITSTVFGIDQYDGQLYFCGAFGAVDGESRTYLASADIETAELSDFTAPLCNNWIDDIVIQGSELFAVGRFTSIDETERLRGASFDLENGGTLTDFDPRFNSIAYMVESDGTNLITGGSFTITGVESRINFAAIDCENNQVLDLGAGSGFNSTVTSLTFDDDRIYAGGFFSQAFGEGRLRFAAINKSDGTLSTLTSDVSNIIYDMEIMGDDLYMGGAFTTVQGESRPYIASINTETGALNDFNPSPNSNVYDMEFFNNHIYFGGSFSFVDGESRGRLASVDLSDNSLSDFDGLANGAVEELEFSDNLLYAGGSFSTIGGESRLRLASLNTVDGSATSWAPSLNGTVLDLFIEENYLFAGGSFSTLDGDPVQRLVLLDKNTGENLFNFAPALNSTVNAVRYMDGKLIFGGAFTIIGSNYAHPYLAQFDVPPPGSSTFAVDLISLTDVNGFDIGCNGDNTGEVEITPTGGTPPYSYTLTNTDEALVRSGDINSSGESVVEANLPAGNYTLVVNDSDDGVANTSILLTEPSAFSADVELVDPVTTEGGDQASLLLEVSGGNGPFTYQYIKDGGDPVLGDFGGLSSIQIENLSAGNYGFTITDANGCETTESIEIDDYVLVVVEFTIWDEIVCNGEDNGVLRIRATQGNPPYTYELDGEGEAFDRSGTLNFSGATAFESDLGPGVYSITVTDQTGVEYSADDLELIEPPVLSATAALGEPVSTPGNNDGEIDVSVMGGVPNYVYLVTRNGSGYTSGTSANENFTVTGLIEGTYVITITDQNSCQVLTNEVILLDGVDPCAGLGGDTDNDGICDDNDPCPLLPDLENGDPCGVNGTVENCECVEECDLSLGTPIVDCVDNTSGDDDYTVTIFYSGSAPGAVLSVADIFGCDNENITISGDDPSTDPNGSIVLTINESESCWGLSIVSDLCDFEINGTSPDCAPPPCGLSLGAAVVACVENTEGVDDYTVSIPYSGIASGATFTFGDDDLCTNENISSDGDDPTTVANGTIVLTIPESESCWSINIQSESCDINLSGASPSCTDDFEGDAASCSDGIDNDGDGLIDCEDGDCQGLTASSPCETCFGDGLSFADEVIEYSNPCPGTTSDDPNEALGTPDYTANNGFVSLGGGGFIKLAFTNNTLVNSGTDDPDLFIFEIGPAVEGSFIELRPLDQATEDALIDEGILDSDGDGFYEFGSVGGATADVDIDAFFDNAVGNSLLFDAIKITDDGSGCSGSTPGADIDGVCALSSLPCSIGAPCDDGDPLTENDVFQPNCECAGEPIYDCPDLMADNGDACGAGGDGIVVDCECLFPDCNGDLGGTVADTDDDGICDDVDNCIDEPNNDQADQDGDEIGDVCDPDIDGDGFDNDDDCDPLDPNVGAPTTWYADSDGDGYGTDDVMMACEQPDGFAPVPGDCDDNNPDINPDAQTLTFTGTGEFSDVLISPLQGAPGTTFNFSVIYTDATGALPPFGFPRVYVDYEGNGSFNNANDQVLLMSPADVSDNNTVDGKEYIASTVALPTGQNYETSIRVQNEGCVTQIGPFDYPDVFTEPDLEIFADNIEFDNPNPDVSSTIMVTAEIFNNSDFPAENFEVDIVSQYEPEIDYPEIFVPLVPPNQSIVVTWNIDTPDEPAWVPIQVIVDSNDDIDETNELDNTAVRPYTNGPFNVPGSINVTASASPAVQFTSPLATVQILGVANYEDTAIPLDDPSVAGATVSLVHPVSGTTYTGNTNSQGAFSITIPANLGPGVYQVSGEVTDFTLTGAFQTSFELIEPVVVCLPDLSISTNVAQNEIFVGETVDVSFTVLNDGCEPSPATTINVTQTSGIPGIGLIDVPALDVGDVVVFDYFDIVMNDLGYQTFCGRVNPEYEFDEVSFANNYDCDGVFVRPPLPDIQVGGYTSELSQFICNNPVLNISFSNVGYVPTGPFTVEYDVIKNGLLDETFTIDVDDLAPGEVQVVLSPYTYEELGTYDIEIRCDVPLPNGEVEEISEANNVASLTRNILECLPQLEVRGCGFFQVDPPNLTESGLPVTYTAKVRNTGNAIAEGPVTLEFELSGGDMYEVVYPDDIAPGQQVDFVTNQTSVVPATQTITATVDPESTIPQFNDTPSSYTADLCWDFRPVGKCGGGNFWNYTYLPNQIVQLNVGVRQDGEYKATDAEVKFEVSGPGIVGTVDLGNAVLPVANRTCACPMVAVLPTSFIFPEPGVFTFTMTADPNATFAECDETNNVLEVEVTVLDPSAVPPDMRILSEYINPSLLNPDPGQPTFFTVTYENVGNSNDSDEMDLTVLVDEEMLSIVENVPGLLSGENTSIAIPIPYSTDVVGAHIVRAIIDSGDEIVEGNEVNNEATRALVVGSAANLYFETFTASDGSPEIGDGIMIDATIPNNGDLDTDADVLLSYTNAMGDTISIGSVPISVDAGGSVDISFPWMVLDNNTELIGEIANSTELEFDYTDNFASTTLGAFDVGLSVELTCADQSEGSITATASGGNEPYTYSWSTGFVGQTLVAGPGTYMVTVTDALGFVSAGSATIFEDPDCIIPECSISPVSFDIADFCDGETGLYFASLTIAYENEPEDGTIDVNGTSFEITGSPQTFEFELDEGPVNFDVSFSSEESCQLMVMTGVTLEACEQDCEGVYGGESLPGSPCTVGGEEGILNENCDCVITEMAFASLLDLECGGMVIQISGAFEGETDGGSATSDTRTIYAFAPDGGNGIPTYAGASWPYVIIDGDLVIDEDITAVLSLNDDGVLLVNGWPAYQFANDQSPDDATGTFGPWNYFLADGELSQDACPPECTTESASIEFEDGSLSQTVCIDDNIPSLVDVNVVVDPSGTNSTVWVITDPDLNVLGLPATLGDVESIDFDQAGPGNCLIWLLDFDPENSNVGNLAMDFENDLPVNAEDLEGCYSLSNSIEVVRIECIPEFDCPELEANIGDACDDGDDMTENDMVNDACECAGTPVEVFDCPDLMANIGDPCDDGDDMTGNDMINADCECVGEPIVPSDCEDWVMYLNDNDGGETDLYGVQLVGGNAELTFLTTIGYQAHIAYNPADNMVYVVSNVDASYVKVNPHVSPVEVSEVMYLSEDVPSVTTAVFSPDGALLIGSATQDMIYSVDVMTNNVTVYDAYAPVNGGDIAFDNEGMLYLATRQGNGLYEVYPDGVWDDILIGSLSDLVTGLALTEDGRLLTSHNGNANLEVRNTDGSNPGDTYALMLDGEAFDHNNGDMASGCNTFSDENEGDCENFDTFYSHYGSGTGVSGADIYQVMYSGNEAVLTFLTNVPFGAHIAYNAEDDILYLVNPNGSFVRAYDPTLGVFIGDLPILGGINSLYAVVYNPVDGLLYVGDDNDNEIYTIDLGTGQATYFADAPVSGGDLAIQDGKLLLANRNQGKLYEIVGGAAVFAADIPAANGMAQANNATGLVLAHPGTASFIEVDAADGSEVAVYTATVGGEALTLSDGDMAAGCGDDEPVIVPDGECYAVAADEYVEGTQLDNSPLLAERADPNNALGAPEGIDALVFTTLGYGGSITVSFDGSVPNGEGDDIEVVETSYNNPGCASYPEYATVEVSMDGVNWATAGTVCKGDPYVDISDAGDYEYVMYVRVTNENDQSTSSDGFDVDGIVALHNCEEDGDGGEGVEDFASVDSQNQLTSFPNPTNGPSQVIFVTAETTRTIVEVYDMKGRLVETLFNQVAEAGVQYRLDFNGTNLPNGVYIYRMTTGGEVIIDKFIMSK